MRAEELRELARRAANRTGYRQLLVLGRQAIHGALAADLPTITTLPEEADLIGQEVERLALDESLGSGLAVRRVPDQSASSTGWRRSVAGATPGCRRVCDELLPLLGWGVIMPVEDRRRAQLRAAATSSLGEEAADTLMELVTPAGQEAATREDITGVLTALDHMDERWSERLAAMDERLDHMDARWSERLDHLDERWSERLAAMDERWEQRSQGMEHRLTATFERGLREAITSQTRALVVSLLVSVVAIAGLAFGLAG